MFNIFLLFFGFVFVGELLECVDVLCEDVDVLVCLWLGVCIFVFD